MLLMLPEADKALEELYITQMMLLRGSQGKQEILSSLGEIKQCVIVVVNTKNCPFWEFEQARHALKESNF